MPESVTQRSIQDTNNRLRIRPACVYLRHPRSEEVRNDHLSYTGSHVFYVVGGNDDSLVEKANTNGGTVVCLALTYKMLNRSAKENTRLEYIGIFEKRLVISEGVIGSSQRPEPFHRIRNTSQSSNWGVKLSLSILVQDKQQQKTSTSQYRHGGKANAKVRRANCSC